MNFTVWRAFGELGALFALDPQPLLLLVDVDFDLVSHGHHAAWRRAGAGRRSRVEQREQQQCKRDEHDLDDHDQREIESEIER